MKVSLHPVMLLLGPLFSQINIIQLALQFRVLRKEKDLSVKQYFPFLNHQFKPCILGIVEPSLLLDLNLVV